jgi:hypothetical protein
MGYVVFSTGYYAFLVHKVSLTLLKGLMENEKLRKEYSLIFTQANHFIDVTQIICIYFLFFLFSSLLS